MTEEFKIEHDVSLPLSWGGSWCKKMPLQKMEVGDSFFVSASNNDATSIREIRGSVDKGIAYFRHHTKTKCFKRFTVRVVNGGVRVWGVEDRPV
jgi:hypothetical protein